jgi:hypothetical protein
VFLGWKKGSENRGDGCGVRWKPTLCVGVADVLEPLDVVADSVEEPLHLALLLLLEGLGLGLFRLELLCEKGNLLHHSLGVLGIGSRGSRTRDRPRPECGNGVGGLGVSGTTTPGGCETGKGRLEPRGGIGGGVGANGLHGLILSALVFADHLGEGVNVNRRGATGATLSGGSTALARLLLRDGGVLAASRNRDRGSGRRAIGSCSVSRGRHASVVCGFATVRGNLK